MKYFAQALVALLLCLSSCSHQQPSSDLTTYVIDTNASRTSIKSSQVLKEARLIALETNDTCLLGDWLDKIVLRGNAIYVQDKLSNSIYKFDLNGRYLSSIRKQGQGPDEYPDISGYDVDDNGNVYIYNYNSIYSYSADGKFLAKKDLPNCIGSIGIMPDGRLLANIIYPPSAKKIGNNLFFVNGDSLYNNGFMSVSDKQSYFNRNLIVSFCRDETGLLLSASNNDTIFTLSDDNITPYARLDYDGRGITNEFLHRDFKHWFEYAHALAEEDFVTRGLFMEGDNFIFNTFSCWSAVNGNSIRTDEKCIFLDKTTRQSYVVSSLTDDLCLPDYKLSLSGFQFSLDERILPLSKNTFAAFIKIESILKAADALPEPQKSQFLNDAKFVSEEQNPLIYIGVLK